MFFLGLRRDYRSGDCQNRGFALELEIARDGRRGLDYRRERLRVRNELIELGQSWRQVLVEDPTNARPIVTLLLMGRVTIAPSAKPKGWHFSGGGTLSGLTLDAWAYAHGVTLRFIRPGKPIENAYVESFNGKFRDECLNEHWFVSLVDAKAVIETWRIDYNTVRPHNSLNGATPDQFAKISEGARPDMKNEDQKLEDLTLSV